MGIEFRKLKCSWSLHLHLHQRIVASWDFDIWVDKGYVQIEQKLSCDIACCSVPAWPLHLHAFSSENPGIMGF